MDSGALPAQTVIVPAPAKVNLFLRVLGQRDDGFHELETVVLPIDLADRLQIHAFADEQTNESAITWRSPPVVTR